MIRPALLALTAVAAAPALADAPLFVVDPSALPFDLGPGAPLNSPARRANLPSAPGNSAAMPGNGGQLRANAPDQRENAPDGGHAIFLGDGTVVGYYRQNGATLNLFDSRGQRVAYRPGGGTKSLFSPDGRWCGTVAATGGGVAFGMTQSCIAAFLR